MYPETQVWQFVLLRAQVAHFWEQGAHWFVPESRYCWGRHPVQTSGVVALQEVQLVLQQVLPLTSAYPGTQEPQFVAFAEQVTHFAAHAEQTAPLT